MRYGKSLEKTKGEAGQIRDFWLKRGMLVNLDIIEALPREPGLSVDYGIRSDMVNGLPVYRLQRAFPAATSGEGAEGGA